MLNKRKIKEMTNNLFESNYEIQNEYLVLNSLFTDYNFYHSNLYYIDNRLTNNQLKLKFENDIIVDATITKNNLLEDKFKNYEKKYLYFKKLIESKLENNKKIFENKIKILYNNFISLQSKREVDCPILIEENNLYEKCKKQYNILKKILQFFIINKISNFLILYNKLNIKFRQFERVYTKLNSCTNNKRNRFLELQFLCEEISNKIDTIYDLTAYINKQIYLFDKSTEQVRLANDFLELNKEAFANSLYQSTENFIKNSENELYILYNRDKLSKLRYLDGSTEIYQNYLEFNKKEKEINNNYRKNIYNLITRYNNNIVSAHSLLEKESQLNHGFNSAIIVKNVELIIRDEKILLDNKYQEIYELLYNSIYKLHSQFI